MYWVDKSMEKLMPLMIDQTHAIGKMRGFLEKPGTRRTVIK